MRLHTSQLANVFVRRIRASVRATERVGELANVFVRRIRACVVRLRGYHTERRMLANVANFGFANFLTYVGEISGPASVISDN